MISQYADHHFKKNRFSGYAFVSFKYESHKRKVLDSATTNFWRLLLNNSLNIDINVDGHIKYDDTHEIKVREAPEPKDVNWKNIHNFVQIHGKKKLLSPLIQLVLFTIVVLELLWNVRE